jgi:UDP-N-acetylglucosamine 2-epimerase (non-hydrolysing)
MTTPVPALVLGTRPEIIKLAPVAHEMVRRRLPFTLIHTGQHYSFNMSHIFLEQLGLRRKIIFLNIGGGSQARQTARALVGLEKLFCRKRPSCVIVEGDTNTVLAGALSGCKLGIPVAHVEAGLRSYDLRMPEEHNRRITDHISTLLFAPTKDNQATLLAEQVPGKTFVTGNTVIDACIGNMPLALGRSRIMEGLGLEKNAYALATIHRAENVDDRGTLAGLISIFDGCPLPVIIPLHPRTVKRARQFGLWRRICSSRNIRVVPPAGYWDFLVLMKNSGFLLSDSGGIQEEVTAPNIRKKCFVLRTSTERQEAVSAGFARMAGVEPGFALKAIGEWWDKGARVPQKKSPFGDGRAAQRIVRILNNNEYC